MPNHKLSSRITDHMQSVGRALLGRRLKHFEAGFPVSREQLQAGILPAKWRRTVLDMVHDGNFIAKTTDPVVWIGDDPIPRPAKMHVDLGSKHVVFCTNPLIFDLDVLDEETKARLVKYTNRVVIEERMTRLANRVIGQFLATYGTTVSHVAARWPALALLTDPEIKPGMWSSRHNDRQLEEWHRRFRDPSDRLNRYRWDYGITWDGVGKESREWYQKHKGAMGLIDTMLAMAKILPANVEDKAECKAVIQTWKPLPDDRDKP